MPKQTLKEMSSETLLERRRDHFKRYLYTVVLMTLFALYLIYLDLVKNSEYSHTVTYIFIAVGVAAITGEVIYKTKKINNEIKKRE